MEQVWVGEHHGITGWRHFSVIFKVFFFGLFACFLLLFKRLPYKPFDSNRHADTSLWERKALHKQPEYSSWLDST